MKKIGQWLKHFFIAHEGNDFKAHVFKDTTISVLAVVAIFTFFAGITQKLILNNSNYLAAVYSGVLVDLANEDREDNSLGELQINPVLEEAARMKAEDMAAKGYFAHYGPDGSSPWDWMKKAGYQFTYAGENLAIDFTDSSDVNQAWLDSPTHRANILNSHFTEIGIATVKGTYEGHSTIFVVQMFGKPLTAVQAALPSITTPVPVNQLAQTNVATNPAVEGASTPTPISIASSVTTPSKTPKPAATSNINTIATSSNTTSTTKETFLAVENNSVASVSPIGKTEIKKESAPISFLKTLTTNPMRTVETVYAFIALLLTIGLVGMVGKDLQTHHLKHAAGGVLLLIIVFSLAYVYKTAVFSDTVVVAFNF